MDSAGELDKIGTVGSTYFSEIEKVRSNKAGPAGGGREGLMKITKALPVLVAAAALLAGGSLSARAQPQNAAAAIAIGEKDIGGVVSGPHGPEAGVWVIAETTELPTRFRRIVGHDDAPEPRR